MSQNKNLNPFKPQQQVTQNPPPEGALSTSHEAAIKQDAGPGADAEQYVHGNTAGPRIFQSEDARSAALSPQIETDDELRDARVGVGTQQQVVVQRSAEMNRMVRVRPKQTHKRFKIGKDWYHIKANVDVLVPKHVAVILEQKGMI